MEMNSLDKDFLVSQLSPEGMREKIFEKVSARIFRHRIASLPFNEAFDRIRNSARELAESKRGDEAAKRIEDFHEMITRKGDLSGEAGDLYAALMQTLTALYIIVGKEEEAMKSAAVTLNLLARDVKRRDEAFLVILALVLYDLSILHTRRSEFRQAERVIEKSMRIFERLAKGNAERYAPAYLIAQGALTAIMRSRSRQASMLAEQKEATEKYMQMVNAGMEGAASHLVNSLAEEGRMLSRMGKYREAIQYFTRSLKYMTKLEGEMSGEQLILSVDLGEALLNVPATRDKGIHLLNTLLHKAVKLHAGEEHRRIVDILANSRSHQLDIIGFWYKLFPK